MIKLRFRVANPSMATSNKDQTNLHIFFFPFLAHGHILPTTNLARHFARRGVNSTIITTPANSALVRPFLNPDLPMNLHLLPFPSPTGTGLPPGCENTASLPQPHSLHTPNLFRAIDLLKRPFADLLRDHRPDFLISDWVYTWTTDLALSLGIPRLVFQTCGAFSSTVCDIVYEHKLHLRTNDDFAPFQVADSFIPDEIELTRAELPACFDHPFALDMFRDAEKKSFGVVMNSFHELEPCYVEFLKGKSTRRLWCVGPVGLGDDDRSHQNIQDGDEVMKWLDSMDPSTVIYICFGSECTSSPDQVSVMAGGLEAAGRPFVWVLRTEEIALPDGFEERTRGKGLVVRGWAPQTKILNHPAVRGFMTHCGWNSILEGVSGGLLMAAWPLRSEQFINEKLVVEVLRIGTRMVKGPGVVVDEETVRESVESLMGGERGLESSARVKEYQAKAKAAVEEGGSSFRDLTRLIEEMVDDAEKRRMDARAKK